MVHQKGGGGLRLSIWVTGSSLSSRERRGGGGDRELSLECLGTVRQAELGHTLSVHLVQQSELAGQLVGLLPLGGELGALLVVVVVGQVLARVGVPAEGPEAVEVDLLAHGRRQSVHEDAGAETLRGQVLGLPVSGGGGGIIKLVQETVMSQQTPTPTRHVVDSVV